MSGHAPSAEPQMPHTGLQQIALAGQNVLPHCTVIDGCPATLVVPATAAPPVELRPPLELRLPPLEARPPVDDPEPPWSSFGDERTTPPQAASARTAHPINHRFRTPEA
jgi:hypothetical protein